MAAVVDDSSSRENSFKDITAESIVLFIIIKKYFVLVTVLPNGYTSHQLLQRFVWYQFGCCGSRHINLAVFPWPLCTHFMAMCKSSNTKVNYLLNLLQYIMIARFPQNKRNTARIADHAQTG